MAEWNRNCGNRIYNSLWHFSLFLSIVALCGTCTDGASVCRETDTCTVDDCMRRLSDPRLFNPGERDSQISRSVLNTWCDVTVRDAVRDVRELEAHVIALKKDTLTCLQSMAEEKGEWMIEKSQLRQKFSGEKLELQRACVEKEHLLRVQLGSERDTVVADLAACRDRLKSMISAEECNYQKHRVLSKCEADRDFSATKLGLQKELVDQSPGEDSQLGSCEDSVTQLQNQMRRLQQSLGSCRFESAEALAIIKAGPEVENLQVEQLRRSVKILSTLLVLSVILSFGLAAALAVWVISTVKGERRLGTYPEVLSSEEACRSLATLFEGNKRDLSSILTSPDPATINGTNCVFQLVPLTPDSTRRFALFGGGGDFTRQVEVAQDLVAHQLRKRLVIVLYHSGGHAFSQKILEGIGLSAEKLAFEAVPKDQDFPSDDDVLVLWRSDPFGLQVSDSAGESELSEIITQQSWAHYLEKRTTL